MDVSRQPSLELTAFVQLCLGGEVVEEYEIRSPVVSIGRSSDCDIVIDNAAVSGFHAVLSQKQGCLLVEDAASTNGVMTRGKKRSSVQLSPGESVDIAVKFSGRLVSSPTGVAKQIRSWSVVVEGDQKATVLVETSTLARLSQNVRPAYLTLSADGKRTWILRLEKPSIVIGASRSADVRVGGWFSPATIAEIERRDDGYFLIVHASRNLEVDGELTSGEIKLSEGTRFRTSQLSGVFHEPSGLPH